MYVVAISQDASKKNTEYTQRLRTFGQGFQSSSVHIHAFKPLPKTQGFRSRRNKFSVWKLCALSLPLKLATCQDFFFFAKKPQDSFQFCTSILFALSNFAWLETHSLSFVRAGVHILIRNIFNFFDICQKNRNFDFLKKILISVHARRVTLGQEGWLSGYRPLPADMRELEWDEELAVGAQLWADRCRFDHDNARVCR